jgi:hypothetical protein
VVVAKVRKLRPTKNGKFPKDALEVKISTQRTEQACSRAMVYLERNERIGFMRAMRKLKPQVEDWFRYVIHTQGKNSADAKQIQAFWANMSSRYKRYREIERFYRGEKPGFDPDVNGIRYG